MNMLIRDKYPELDRILWDFHVKMIPADMAFSFYEERWSFVDKKKITRTESALITRLVAEYGKGTFMPIAA